MKFVLYLFMSCVWFVVAKYISLEIAFATAFGLLFVELIEIQCKIGYKKMTTPIKEQSLDIERAMGFEIPWYRIEEIIIRWEKIRNSTK